MKRWGLLGLVAVWTGTVLACNVEPPAAELQEERNCPGVWAGSQQPEAMAQRVWTSPPTPAPADGRQPFLIRFSAQSTSSASLVRRTGGQVTRALRSLPVLAARLTPEERAALAARPEVEALEPDVEWHALGTTVRGSPGEYTQGLRQVQAPHVWDTDGDGVLDVGAPTGEGVKVCIVDSGIDPGHPELAGRIVGGRDFVDEDDDPSDRTGELWGQGHGTHVAGTVAAQLAEGGRGEPDMDSGGVAGVAPRVQLLIARVLNLEGRANLSTVLSAVEWCHQQGARLASLSLGGGQWGETAQQLFQKVHDEGMLVVAAAGNDGGALLYPAAFPSVLAVGAVDDQAQRAPFSSHGDNLALMAPGVDVLSTYLLGRGSFTQVEVDGAPHASRTLIAASEGDVSGELVDCGFGGSRASCQGGSCAGFVAYVELSGNRLESVLVNVIRQGAHAIILGHPKPGGAPETLLLDPGRWVPGAMVGHSSAQALRGRFGQQSRVRLRPTDYARFSGTSMSAPHVSGVAALLLGERPSLTPNEVRLLLERSALDLGAPGYDLEYGHGLVQARAALELLRQQP